MDKYIDELVKLYNSGESFQTIAAKFNSTYARVRNAIISAGIVPRQRRIEFSDLQIKDILHKYSTEYSAQKIAKEYCVHIRTIKRVVEENGGVWKNDPCDFKIKEGVVINRDCFKEFNTEKEKYFYGLLLADGCISDKNTVSILLHSKDVDILIKFKNFLQYNKEIKKAPRQDAMRISFKDKVLADKLKSVGLHPRKSLNENVPSFYDRGDISMRHFWRGFTDGDGCVQSTKSFRSRLFSIIGTKEILQEFEIFCRTFAGASERKLYKHPSVNKNCYEIRYCGIEASRIAALIYGDCSIYLERKKIQADFLAEQVEVVKGRIAKEHKLPD